MLTHVCMRTQKDQVIGGIQEIISREIVLLVVRVTQRIHMIPMLTLDMLRVRPYQRLIHQYNSSFNNFRTILQHE